MRFFGECQHSCRISDTAHKNTGIGGLSNTTYWFTWRCACLKLIDAVLASIARERADALLVVADGFLNSRRGQFATLSARDRLPTAMTTREAVEVGNLMSYGTSIADMFRQAGLYSGSIVKGAKPAELPVLQMSKFEFVINLQTARALGIKVSPSLLARADEVIE